MRGQTKRKRQQAAAGESPLFERPVFERMEPRILLSADLPGLDVVLPPTHHDQVLPDPVDLQAIDASPNDVGDSGSPLDTQTDPAPRQLLIIDGAVDDLETLVKDFRAAGNGQIGAVFILDPARDGVEQVGEILSAQQDLAAVHIVSHGSDGALVLGSSRLDAASLDGYADALGQWGQGLSADGDLLLYGCDLAASAKGRQLVDAIADLSGADVAASDDITGAAAAGGDWQLEYQAGVVETRTDALGEVARWDGALGSITVTYFNDQLSADADLSSLAALSANPGSDGEVSLREAILAANNDPGQDTVTLLAGTYQIEISGAKEDAGRSGDLDVSDDLILQGAGATATVLDGRGLDRVLHLSGGTLDVAGLSIINGDAGGQWGGGVMVEKGTTLVLDQVVLQNNQAKWGGALQVEGALQATDFIMDGNTASSEGGAINLEGNGATAILSQGTFSGNDAGGSGGGLYVFKGTVDLSNVTLSGNVAGADGGGLYNSGGTTRLVHVTVADNQAGGSGGGLLNDVGQSTLDLQATLVANNVAPADADVSGTVTSDGSNLIRDPGTAAGLGGDLTGVDPLLGALADNGGPTPTHVLLAGSPAIDAAAGSTVTLDQRHQVRALDGNGDGTAVADIGAYEYRPPPLAAESFGYAVGTLEGASGGSGWATGWNTSIGYSADAVATSLSDQTGTLLTSGGAADLNVTNLLSLYAQSREMDPAFTLGADNTTAWVSFLLQPSATGSDEVALRLGDENGSYDTLRIGYNGSDFILKKNVLGDTVRYSNQVVAGQTYLLVARLDFKPGADTVSLYVDPTPGLAAPDTVMVAQLTTADLGTFTQVGMVAYKGDNSRFDEIRLGTSYAAVTPTASGVVPAGNRLPVANSDTAGTAEDTPVVIDVLANDSDPDGDALTVIAASAGNGSVGINADGTLSYTPAADFNGSDSISYTVDDGNGGRATTTVAVTVAPVDDPTVTAPDTGSAAEDSIASGNVLANDSDVDNALSVASFTVAGDATVYGAGQTATIAGVGSLTLGSDGGYTFTPVADWNGSVPQVSYTTNTGASDTLDIVITPVDDPTVTAPDTDSAAEDSIASGNVLANDSDVDNALSVASFTVAGDATVYGAGQTATIAGVGSLTLGSDGGYTFTPVADWNGSVPQATYTTNTGASDTLDIAITPVDDPTVTAPDTVSAAEDNAASGNVLANDSDVDNVLSVASFTVAGDATVYGAGQTATIAGVGSLTLGSDGGYTFTPVANWNGSVPQVSYTTNTGASDTLDIMVTPVNDAPTTSPVVLAPVTENSGARLITQGELLSGANDIEGDSLIATGLAISSGGGVLVDNGDGTWSYTPAPNDDTSVGFSYSVSDGAASTPGTATLDIVPVTNSAPVAADDSASTNEDTALTINAADLLANDSDPDGDPLVIVAVTQPANGSLTDNGDGTFTYTPNPDFNGTDSFGYTVSDGNGGSDTATVTLTVAPRNDAPVAADDSASTNEDVALTINAADLLTNDSDPDGDPLAIVAVTQPANGSLTDNGDGTFTYTPNPDFNGTDSFGYTVSDGNGGSDTATVTVAVTTAVAPPAAVSTVPPETDGERPEDQASAEEDGEKAAAADAQAASERPGRVVATPPTLAFEQADGIVRANAVETEQAVSAFPGAEAARAAGRSAPGMPISGISPLSLPGWSGRWDHLAQSPLANEIRLLVQSDLYGAELDRVRSEITAPAASYQVALETATAATTALSVGYVAWLLRGGVLLSTMLSSLPAWQVIDPLPVLARTGQDDAEDEESLEGIIEKGASPERKEEDSSSAEDAS